MPKSLANLDKLTAQEREHMHAVYRQGGKERQMAPHIVYQEEGCPHPDCGRKMQAIYFRLENCGPATHDPLVQAWWNDVGFAGRCPRCGGWIHFTIDGKTPISAAEAEAIKLPDDWYTNALVL